MEVFGRSSQRLTPAEGEKLAEPAIEGDTRSLETKALFR